MLDRVFGDLGKDEFFERYWLRAPLLIPRHDPVLFADLIDADDIYELLYTRNSRFPELALVQNNHTFPAKSYCREYRSDGVSVHIPIPEKLIALFRGGATIQLRVLHTGLPKIGEVAHLLEAYFECPISAIGFLAPPAARSFNSHVDPGGTLVIQVFGTKMWRVPRHIHSNDFSDAMELVLGPGSVLYLPPGWWHDTIGGGEASLGLSFEIRNHTLGDLVAELVRDLEAGLPLADPLPLAPNGSGNLADCDGVGQLRDRLQAGLDGLTDDKVRSLIVRRFGRVRMPNNRDRFLDAILPP